MAARGEAGFADGGVGFAGGQDFFDLAHGVNPLWDEAVSFVSRTLVSYAIEIILS
jgi:hypothetical protein